MPSHNDNIIDRVMKSQDLSKHEKALLGCIVKPGTHLLLIQEKTHYSCRNVDDYI